MNSVFKNIRWYPNPILERAIGRLIKAMEKRGISTRQLRNDPGISADFFSRDDMHAAASLISAQGVPDWHLVTFEEGDATEAEMGCFDDEPSVLSSEAHAYAHVIHACLIHLYLPDEIDVSDKIVFKRNGKAFARIERLAIEQANDEVRDRVERSVKRVMNQTPPDYLLSRLERVPGIEHLRVSPINSGVPAELRMFNSPSSFCLSMQLMMKELVEGGVSLSTCQELTAAFMGFNDWQSFCRRRSELGSILSSIPAVIIRSPEGLTERRHYASYAEAIWEFGQAIRQQPGKLCLVARLCTGNERSTFYAIDESEWPYPPEANEIARKLSYGDALKAFLKNNWMEDIDLPAKRVEITLLRRTEPMSAAVSLAASLLQDRDNAARNTLPLFGDLDTLRHLSSGIRFESRRFGLFHVEKRYESTFLDSRVKIWQLDERGRTIQEWRLPVKSKVLNIESAEYLTGTEDGYGTHEPFPLAVLDPEQRAAVFDFLGISSAQQSENLH